VVAPIIKIWHSKRSQSPSFDTHVSEIEKFCKKANIYVSAVSGVSTVFDEPFLHVMIGPLATRRPDAH
jgi:hypothetical protein